MSVRRKRRDTPLLKRTLKEQLRAKRLLYGDSSSSKHAHLYDSAFHPKDIVRHFSARYEQLEDPERYATEHRLQYETRPVRPPSMASYAAEIGVGRDTIWIWGERYEEFGDALAHCKAMQEAILLELAATGALNNGFVALMMKNLHGWQDKVEATHRGGVTLVFDKQDEDA